MKHEALVILMDILTSYGLTETQAIHLIGELLTQEAEGALAALDEEPSMTLC